MKVTQLLADANVKSNMFDVLLSMFQKSSRQGLSEELASNLMQDNHILPIAIFNI